MSAQNLLTQFKNRGRRQPSGKARRHRAAPLFVELLEDRVTPTAMATVASAIEALQFTDPLQPGYGAILTYAQSNGPGDYDATSGAPIYEVNPYLANLAVTGLLQTQATGSLQTASLWISWYLANINNDGSINNFWYQANGAAGAPSVNPASVQPDSVDAYAGAFLTLSWDYLQAGGSASLFTAAGVQQEYESIAGAILSLQDTDGLTWATPTDHVKYLADNSEVYSGLLAAANLETAVFDNSSNAALYSQAAGQVSQAIQSELFDQSTGLFDIDLQSDGAVDEADFTSGADTTWYPTVSIIWPAMNGVISPSSVEAQDQFAALDGYWNGSSASQPDWTDNLVDAVNRNPAVGFVWPAAGYAALLANDAARGQTDINWVYNQEFTGQADPPPMTVADAGWLLRGLNVLAGNVPTSTVSALPAGESSPSFALSWSGQGYTGGPAIASFDIFVSDNGGPFTPLLTNTTQTSATFAGQIGHSYSFFSVAADFLGNVQPTPTTQATTFVQSTPAITWNTPSDIVYGTSLDATELDATANIDGSFTYTLADDTTPATGAVLNVGEGQTLNVAFTPTDTTDYASAAASVAINVTQASQTILFNVNGPANYGTPITLSAIGGGSGNPVTFTVVSGSATLNGDVLAFTGLGSVIVEANQAGSTNYAAAAPVQQTIAVTTPTISTPAENENAAPIAFTVLSLLGSNYKDPDGAVYTKPGIAVFLTSGAGTWQYSANGTTWIAVGSVSQTQALLLPSADALRFAAAASWSGQANLSFVAWDGSQGKSGTFANIAVSGGATPFSVNAGTVALTVKPVPSWVGTGPALTPLLPGVYSTSNLAAPPGQSIASVFAGYFQDNNPAVSVGVAIDSVTGLTSGVWQFLTNGGAVWTNFPAVSSTSVLFLSANDQIRYVPKSNFAGVVALKALAWDGSVGVDGLTGNPAKLASSAFSTTILAASAPINRAPTLRVATISEGSIVQYAISPAITVSSLLTKAGYADPDGAGLPQGIAVINGHGRYMLAGGTWQPLPSVSSASALLLPSTASLELAAGSQIGSVALTFEGWDETQGTAGQTFDIATNGGAAAFSTASTVVSITVTASTNHAPTLSTASISEAAVAVKTVTPTILVSTLLTQAGYADPNVRKSPQGIAIIGAVLAGGTAQYELPGGTWQAMPAVSPSSALLLPKLASVRFVAGSEIGTATLTFEGWDQSQGAPMHPFNIENTGGASAFSVTSATVSIPIKQAPSWSATTGAAMTPLLPGAYSTSNAGGPPGNTVASIFGIYFVDANPSLAVGVAISAVTGNGVWQYSLTNGATWVAFTPSKTSARLLAADDLVRFVPKTTAAGSATLSAYAWDGSVGTPGATANLTTIGGASAYSATTLLASSPVNTAPTLTTASILLPAVNENVASPGLTAASLLSKAGYADPDGKTVPSGIAITGDSGPGTWQWLNGATWTTLASVSSTLAFLLPGAGQVRFLPANNLPTNAANMTATLTYAAWDETVGAADKTFAVSAQGGASAFSTNTATATLPINFVKQAPTWLAGATASFTPVVGLSTANLAPNPAGNTVAAVFGGAFVDAANLSVGVAVTALTGTPYGSWQYSTNGGTTWHSFPTIVSTSAALLLHATDEIRFVPSKAFSGTVALTAYAWDGTGTTGNLLKTGTGGVTPFSRTVLTASCLVNSAPTLI